MSGHFDMFKAKQSAEPSVQMPNPWRGLAEPEPETEQEVPMLIRAEKLINGQRQKDYGDKLQNFAQIAMLFQGVLATKLAPTERITAEDVALLMMQVKIARLAKSPDHRDSILDVAGYAGCYDKILDERLRPDTLRGATKP